MDEVYDEGEIFDRLGDISYMFYNIYEDIEEFSLNNKNAYLVYDGDVIVGFIHVSLNPSNEAVLYLGIHNDYRGLGYGSLITRDISNYLLMKCNVSCIRVQIEEDNIASKKVCAKAGFQLLENDFYVKRR